MEIKWYNILYHGGTGFSLISFWVSRIKPINFSYKVMIFEYFILIQSSNQRYLILNQLSMWEEIYYFKRWRSRRAPYEIHVNQSWKDINYTLLYLFSRGKWMINRKPKWFTLLYKSCKNTTSLRTLPPLNSVIYVILSIIIWVIIASVCK